MPYSGIASVAARYTKDMTIAKAFFYLAVSLLAAVALSGLYLFYKNTQAPNATQMVQMFRQGTLASAPPTSCSYRISNFEGTDEGILRIADGNIFLKTLTVKGNQGGQLQAVVAKDGTYHIDPSTSGVMLQGGSAKEAVGAYITDKPWECSPWWSPDETLFNVSE